MTTFNFQNRINFFKNGSKQNGDSGDKKASETNYKIYQLSMREWFAFSAFQAAKICLIAYLFYNSFLAIPLTIPICILDYRKLIRKKLKEQSDNLTHQFKDMMEAISTSLSAGYSIEHSFEDARRDLRLLYEKDAIIFKELDRIISGISLSIPAEKLLKNFGDRSGVEDIENFAYVIETAKRSGGNMIKIISKTVRSISGKIAAKEEIDTMIAARKLEQRIMTFVPYGIILYLRISSKELLMPMYGNLIGVFFMSVFLAIIQISDIWSEKIMNIEV